MTGENDLLDWEVEQAEQKKVEEILSSLGITMRVSGCGCCDSPHVYFVYKGEVLLDTGNVEIDNIPPEKESTNE